MRVRFGKCLLDSDTRELFVGGKPVHLEPKAFQLLELLLQERPKALSKKQIHEKLWPGVFVADTTLTSALADVRNAIGDKARKALFVRTVYGFGYAFGGDAQEIQPRRPGVAGRLSSCWLMRGRNRIPLAPGATFIGRDEGASVTIDDDTVSRLHARIVVDGDGVRLEDLDSKNGTFLGDTRVKSPLPLSDGDKIRIGEVALTVRIVPASGSTRTAGK